MFQAIPEPAQMKPASFDEMSNKVRERLNSGEFWILVFDSISVEVLEILERRFYFGEAASDLDVMILRDSAFGLFFVSARKRRMRDFELISILRQRTMIRLKERSLLNRNLIICATPQRIDDATALTRSMLHPDSVNLAMVA